MSIPQTPPTDRPLTAGDDKCVGRYADRPWMPGDDLPDVGTYALVSGANCDVDSDKHRGYMRRRVVGYGIDDAFICFQTDNCWPTVERTTNCWFARIESPRPATSAASEGEGVVSKSDAIRAVDACGGTYSPDEERSGYADGHREALTAALSALAALASPPVSERERELEGALGLIADGWGVIESSGSMGEMTLQAPDDWEGDQTEIVVKFHGLTAQPQEPV